MTSLELCCGFFDFAAPEEEENPFAPPPEAHEDPDTPASYEHLIIVTELLRDSLFSFYRYLQSTGRRLDYFTSPVLASLSSQLLSALAFLHDNGLAHCDVKPENVLLHNGCIKV